MQRGQAVEAYERESAALRLQLVGLGATPVTLERLGRFPALVPPCECSGSSRVECSGRHVWWCRHHEPVANIEVHRVPETVQWGTLDRRLVLRGVALCACVHEARACAVRLQCVQPLPTMSCEPAVRVCAPRHLANEALARPDRYLANESVARPKICRVRVNAPPRRPHRALIRDT